MKSDIILVDTQQGASSISLLQNGELKEHYVEIRKSNYITGNIYCGKVVNVLQGLQSAFIDIGRDRNGFLSVEETMDHKSVMKDVIPKQIRAKNGEYILVQATKEELGNKGARLTTNISLAGRYVIFLPTLDFVGVSNKILDENKRNELTALLKKHKGKDTGLIARTICLEAKKSHVVAEIKRLKNQWDNIIKNFNNTLRICKIYDDGDIVFRTVRDILSSCTEAVYCNSLDECEFLRNKLKTYNPDFVEKIKYYSEPIDMYEKYDIISQVDKLLQKKVMLPSGGSLVFDYTEALTVIDVNTCKYIGNGNHEETVFNANLEAATEIARQIRLRNIGGIIIIDFIDMFNDEHKKQVMQRLSEEMRFDRTKTRVADMTELGLVEVTRKKTGKELSTILLDKCPHCDGTALTYSKEYMCRKIKVALSNCFLDDKVLGVSLQVTPSLADYMLSSRYFDIVCSNEWIDKRIYVIPSDSVSDDEFALNPYYDEVMSLPSKAILLY